MKLRDLFFLVLCIIFNINNKYIDPLSRGTSSKSNRMSNLSSSKRKENDDVRYARVTEQLRRWTSKSD
jgi:hypothetical protein